MDNFGILNLISLTIGITLIILGCTTAYLFQKHLFNKYKNKAKNTINKDEPTKQN